LSAVAELNAPHAAGALRSALNSQAIRFQRPGFPSPEAIERYFGLAREERWYSNFGPCSELFRERLTEATGRPCVVVNNATVGLMVALAALLDRSPRGATEVLVPSFAFAASAQIVCWNGLSPVFVDVGAEHWHLDPAALEHALEARGSRVAAVVALSSFGAPPPPEVRRGWENACADAGVPLLVDSAAGFGAEAADGVPIGAQGDAEVVSFHATKPLSAGEGGAVFCRDEELAATVLSIANFSFDDRHLALRANGTNAKLPELSAAVGLASLDDLPAALAARRERAAKLLHLLPETFTAQDGGARGTYQFVPVAAPDTATRDRVLEAGAAREIGMRTYYEPLDAMLAFAGCVVADELAVTRDIAARMVSLPMAVDLDDAEIASVADAVGAGAGLELRS
jgi:dTDP-4-amino-4,6-dideoxygalactose transaminase